MPPRQVTPEPPALLHRPGVAGDLRELAALTREGLLRHVVGDVFVEAAEPDEPLVRALAAGALLDDRRSPDEAAVCGASALWVWAGGPPPVRLEIVRPVGGGRSVSGWLELRESRIAPQDVATLHGVRLTTPLRTACDVARWLEPGQARHALDLLAAATGVTPAGVAAALESLSRCRGVIPARDTVREWSRQAAGQLRAPAPVTR